MVPQSPSVLRGVRLGRWDEMVGNEQWSPQGCWLNSSVFAEPLEQPQRDLLEPGPWLQWGTAFLLSLLPVLISENLACSSDRERGSWRHQGSWDSLWGLRNKLFQFPMSLSWLRLLCSGSCLLPASRRLLLAAAHCVRSLYCDSEHLLLVGIEFPGYYCFC